ncbi:MAG: Kynurenine formamidase, partial [Chlamydiae bacterium]|nr:Kynurenine formamidase [Chlamydiota bacterium]
MGIYDISLTLTENMPVWPGDAKPHFERALKMEEGEIANVTHIKMSAHTGTHVDAPYH